MIRVWRADGCLCWKEILLITIAAVLSGADSWNEIEGYGHGKMWPPEAVGEEVDCGHGRVAPSRCSVLSDLSLVEQAADWAGPQSLVRIEAESHHKLSGKTEREIRCDIRFYVSLFKFANYL